MCDDGASSLQDDDLNEKTARTWTLDTFPGAVAAPPLTCTAQRRLSQSDASGKPHGPARELAASPGMEEIGAVSTATYYDRSHLMSLAAFREGYGGSEKISRSLRVSFRSWLLACAQPKRPSVRRTTQPKDMRPVESWWNSVSDNLLCFPACPSRQAEDGTRTPSEAVLFFDPDIVTGEKVEAHNITGSCTCTYYEWYDAEDGNSDGDFINAQLKNVVFRAPQVHARSVPCCGAVVVDYLFVLCHAIAA